MIMRWSPLFHFIFIGYSSKRTDQTEEYLMIRQEIIPWSNIDHITLKRSEFGNRYIVVYFKDDKPPNGYDIELFNNEAEVNRFIKELEKNAAQKGFQFTSDIDLELEEEAEPQITGEYKGKEMAVETEKTEIEFSPRAKRGLMISLAVIFFVVAYFVFGLDIAVSVFIVILVHEGGHYAAMRLWNIEVSGMYFIPFIGAGVAPEEEIPSPGLEASISLSGPVAGLLFGVAALLFRVSSFIPSLIEINVIINLLNLMPILPLDGGRVVRAALLRGRKSLIPVALFTVGTGVLVAIAIGSYILLLIALLGLVSLIRDYKRMERKEMTPPTWGQSLVILAAWLGIIFLYLMLSVFYLYD